MKHSTHKGYVISSKGAWIPGIYETKKAAYYAFQFSDHDLELLNSLKAAGQVITSYDLGTLRESEQCETKEQRIEYIKRHA